MWVCITSEHKIQQIWRVNLKLLINVWSAIASRQQGSCSSAVFPSFSFPHQCKYISRRVLSVQTEPSTSTLQTCSYVQLHVTCLCPPALKLPDSFITFSLSSQSHPLYNHGKYFQTNYTEWIAPLCVSNIHSVAPDVQLEKWSIMIKRPFLFAVTCICWVQRPFAWNNSLILLWQMFWRSLMMPTSGIAGNLTPCRGESFSYPFRGRWFAVKSSEMRRSRLPVKWYVENTLQLLWQSWSLANIQVWDCVCKYVSIEKYFPGTFELRKSNQSLKKQQKGLISLLEGFLCIAVY